MTSETTQIKNIIISHLRKNLFEKWSAYGTHEIPLLPGNDVMVIECRGASRFEKYGQAVIYHPLLGKWVANLTSDHSCGKPVQALTVDQIKASKTRSPMIAKVFNIELDTSVVVWDVYNYSS